MNRLGTEINVKLLSYSLAEQLAGDLSSIALKTHSRLSGEKRQVFHPASDTEIKELIFNSPNKPCDLDPLPTWLQKNCIQPTTAIINRSLAERLMPPSLPYAAVIPLLKKNGMDEEDMSSYCPISNLHFFQGRGKRDITYRKDHS